MLEEFLIKIGLGKLPVGEKRLRRREEAAVQPEPARDNRRRQREVEIFIPKPAGGNRLAGPVVKMEPVEDPRLITREEPAI